MAMTAALAACSTEPGGDLFDVIAVVRGTVTDAAGDPVSSANVVATAAYSLANGNVFDITDSVRTDASGRYTISLRILNAPDADAPAMVKVRPAATHSGAALSGVVVHFDAYAATDTTIANVEVDP